MSRQSVGLSSDAAAAGEIACSSAVVTWFCGISAGGTDMLGGPASVLWGLNEDLASRSALYV